MIAQRSQREQDVVSRGQGMAAQTVLTLALPAHIPAGIPCQFQQNLDQTGTGMHPSTGLQHIGQPVSPRQDTLGQHRCLRDEPPASLCFRPIDLTTTRLQVGFPVRLIPAFSLL
ncbi:MAG: hypothetical protein Q9M35_06475 [Rhodothermus sp.]|nr:hypothetical protein [Rhodothermus sp.]